MKKITVSIHVDNDIYEGELLLVKSSSGRVSKKQKTTVTKDFSEKPLQTLSQRINFLIEQGFFKTEREVQEIVMELKNNGWTYNAGPVLVQLLRSVRPPQRILRRIAAKTGGKSVYKYVNP